MRFGARTEEFSIGFRIATDQCSTATIDTDIIVTVREAVRKGTASRGCARTSIAHTDKIHDKKRLTLRGAHRDVTRAEWRSRDGRRDVAARRRCASVFKATGRSKTKRKTEARQHAMECVWRRKGVKGEYSTDI